VSWWVGEGGIRTLLSRAHQIAVLFRHQVGAEAVRNVAGDCHATLRRAVGLDGSIALADIGPAVEAAGVAGGAEVINPAVISRAADPPTMLRFILSPLAR
jgi:hypothetical protein